MADAPRLRVLIADDYAPLVRRSSASSRTMPSTKVIVLTGGLDPELHRDVLAAGASAFIDKSASPRDLLTAIAEIRAQ